MSYSARMKALEARLAALEERLADAEEDIELLEDESDERKKNEQLNVNPFDMPFYTYTVPPVQSCTCPMNTVCMSTACPRRMSITCSNNNNNTALDGLADVTITCSCQADGCSCIK